MAAEAEPEKRGRGRPRSDAALSPAEKQARYRERLRCRLDESWEAEEAAVRDAKEAEQRADRLLDAVDAFDNSRLFPALTAAKEGGSLLPITDLFDEHRRLFELWRTALAERNALYRLKGEAFGTRCRAEDTLNRSA